jgi:hypothetical protein
MIDGRSARSPEKQTFHVIEFERTFLALLERVPCSLESDVGFGKGGQRRKEIQMSSLLAVISGDHSQDM